MANDLVSTPWSPPESAIMQKVVKYGGTAALAGAAIYAFTLFAPTMVSALTLAALILSDATHMVISGVVLVITLWLARETLSPTGSINHLLRLPYWSIVNGLTKLFIVIDPLTRLDTRIASVRADQNIFERQFETLAGLISNLREKAARYREASLKAQRLGVAASRTGATAAADVSAHKFGSFKEAADSFDATAARLEPARATFQKISQAVDVTAQKLEIERDILADKWATQKAVHAATDSASRILGRSKTQVWADAQQAEQIIDDKYGEELGHLEHLKSYAEPFLQSIDVENASYSEDMLAQIQTGGAKLVQSTEATQLPAPSVAYASIDTTPADTLSGLIHN